MSESSPHTGICDPISDLLGGAVCHAAYGVERFERKFVSPGPSTSALTAIIRQSSGLFRVAYPARLVNNIYLDTDALDNYRDNEAGCQNRLKVRVRWYNELKGDVDRPVLELKAKSGLRGRKARYSMAKMNLSDNFRRSEFLSTLRASGLPGPLAGEVSSMRLVLANSYRREYFVSADGNLRVTLDSDLRFYRLGHRRGLFETRPTSLDQVILEMKYEPAREEIAADISNCFPFRLSRCSKYVNGVRLLGIV